MPNIVILIISARDYKAIAALLFSAVTRIIRRIQNLSQGIVKGIYLDNSDAYGKLHIAVFKLDVSFFGDP